MAAQVPIAAGELWVEHGGRGRPVLLLLHGLGATAAVWEGCADSSPGAGPAGG